MMTSKDILARKDVLAALRQQRVDANARIRKSANRIRTTAHDLFAPPKSTDKVSRMMTLVDQGIAMYDGVMLGMKVMRSVRHLFGRR